MSDVGEHLYALVNLTSTDEARRFMRASEDIELEIQDAWVEIVNTADYKPGEAPPANESPEAGLWLMFGVIHGANSEGVPKEKKAEVLEKWTLDIIEILQRFGLGIQREVPS
jgi:hypothetical protein